MSSDLTATCSSQWWSSQLGHFHFTCFRPHQFICPPFRTPLRHKGRRDCLDRRAFACPENAAKMKRRRRRRRKINETEKHTKKERKRRKKKKVLSFVAPDPTPDIMLSGWLWAQNTHSLTYSLTNWPPQISSRPVLLVVRRFWPCIPHTFLTLCITNLPTTHSLGFH